jgi:hypothetical protein
MATPPAGSRPHAVSVIDFHSPCISSSSSSEQSRRRRRRRRETLSKFEKSVLENRKAPPSYECGLQTFKRQQSNTV